MHNIIIWGAADMTHPTMILAVLMISTIFISVVFVQIVIVTLVGKIVWPNLPIDKVLFLKLTINQVKNKPVALVILGFVFFLLIRLDGSFLSFKQIAYDQWSLITKDYQAISGQIEDFQVQRFGMTSSKLSEHDQFKLSGRTFLIQCGANSSAPIGSPGRCLAVKNGSWISVAVHRNTERQPATPVLRVWRMS